MTAVIALEQIVIVASNLLKYLSVTILLDYLLNIRSLQH